MNAYPLKFKAIFKDKIWGGQKIGTILKKDYSPLPNCGETWELSAVEGNVSIVDNGELAGEPLDRVIAAHRNEILGSSVVKKFGDEFPLLIKFIDAKEDLSVQVHPDDELAQVRHQGKGKTEMWYILQADADASLIAGFNQPMDKTSYLDHFNKGALNNVLNRVSVHAGDVFFIPAGRIHTIGKGILLAEIQQTSDITYRIYDFDRIDAEGNKRQLHTQEALDALDYKYYDTYKTPYTSGVNKRISLVQAEYFTTNKFELDQPLGLDYAKLDSFVIHIFTKGQGHLKYGDGEEAVKMGDVYLLPATMKQIQIVPDGKLELLEVYVEA
ncbi:Mannose-6-phosphate isomerase [Fulvivirga imtechensis AK7]|uniref:Phosphohexomutase n=1 Tax=Fulvivirga imtechensis AK7 TaxID=1237149 RepID=L8JND1_9BACT|nr:type I phosphomannose isomerase catalytic subunit [Fulvivirga imtechensis]ELR70456.1 Mannose-6-phosphate isomerase [Fulvivirga imtechensis AK7]